MKILKFNESFGSEITKTKGITLKSSTPVMNCPGVLQFIVDIQKKSYEEDMKNLSKNLIEELSLLFGEPNKRLRLEYNTKVWCLKFKELEFNIFTSKGKGTSIELCTTFDDIRTGSYKDEIIEFLTELHKSINK